MNRVKNILISLSIFCSIFGQDVMLSIDGQNVNYTSTSNIGGWQFNSDTDCELQSSDISGGATQNAGLFINCSQNSFGSTCLSFSFSGSSIPAGSGTLFTLSQACNQQSLTDWVFSSDSAQGLTWAWEGSGCTDSNACNYDSQASTDDGSCIYAEDGFDCNGDCLDGSTPDCDGVCGGNEIEDCAGVCGGLAYEDLCGVCDPIPFNDNTTCVTGCTDRDACNYNSLAVADDGSCTYPEDNFDCDGDCLVETDCAGTCGGDAVVDDCGECGGDGSACSQSTIDILYSSALPIGGFQFDISGANLISASGGAAAAMVFQFQHPLLLIE